MVTSKDLSTVSQCIFLSLGSFFSKFFSLVHCSLVLVVLDISIVVKIKSIQGCIHRCRERIFVWFFLWRCDVLLTVFLVPVVCHGGHDLQTIQLVVGIIIMQLEEVEFQLFSSECVQLLRCQ